MKIELHRIKIRDLVDGYVDDDEKRSAYEAQKGVCPICGGHFEYEEMEGDHIVPWSKGGRTVPENLQMLCRRDNALKSDR